MPLFDFKCGVCDNTFEELYRLGDCTPKCPKCGAREYVERQISSGIRLIGSARQKILSRANNPQTEPTHVYINRMKDGNKKKKGTTKSS